MLHGGVAGLLLAENSESAADGCAHADQVLQTADREAVDAAGHSEWRLPSIVVW